MALTKEDLQAIGELMDAKLEPIKENIAEMKEDIAEIKEHAEITRSATNSLVEWAETVGGVTLVKFPVEKVNNG